MNILTLSNYVCYKDTIYDGQFSTIYKAYKIKDRTKLFAIKKIKKNINKTYIHDEINIMKKIKHKHVVTLYEGIYHKRSLYLVLEYCNGGHILEYIQSTDHSYDQRYITQIIEGMKYLYRYNIIHRDIKPQNILIQDHCIKICDFGLSKSMYLNTVHNSICGSSNYIAPEIFKYKKYSRKSDIWSLGIILYEIIYKKHPYPNINIKKYTDFKFIYNPIQQTSNIYILIEKMLIVNDELRMNWSDILEYTLMFDIIQKPIHLHTSSPVPIGTPIRRNRSNSMFISNTTLCSHSSTPRNVLDMEERAKSVHVYSSSAPVIKLSNSLNTNYIDRHLNKDKHKMKNVSSSTDLNYHDIIGESPKSNQDSFFSYYYNKLIKSKK